ncbi:FdtA/QdtA family cupin domain-containing protein [Flavobacteriaceae bacterium]|nr:FdtA/QdtA family cupin domain-containing protein [Flavobacteriaceae bacterium]
MFEIIDFPLVSDSRGNLVYFQNSDQIPFKIKRVYLYFESDFNLFTNGYSFKEQDEVMVALNGGFDVTIQNFDGSSSKISINRKNQGLYLKSNTWRHIKNLSKGTIILFISNCEFKEEDIIKNIKDLN